MPGDAANVAARLSSAAAQGEILLSEGAYQAAEWAGQPVEKWLLSLKGKSAPLPAFALSLPTAPD